MHLSPSTFEELRVPVRRADVKIHAEHGDRHVVIFLAPDASAEDLLEQETPFFPAEDGGAIRLFARAGVASIVVDDTTRESLSQHGIPHEKRPVAVCLTSGKVIRGTLEIAGRTRTLDFLNQPAKSFAIRSDGKVHHIVKARVAQIQEVR